MFAKCFSTFSLLSGKTKTHCPPFPEILRTLPIFVEFNHGFKISLKYPSKLGTPQNQTNLQTVLFKADLFEENL